MSGCGSSIKTIHKAQASPRAEVCQYLLYYCPFKLQGFSNLVRENKVFSGLSELWVFFLLTVPTDFSVALGCKVLIFIQGKTWGDTQICRILSSCCSLLFGTLPCKLSGPTLVSSAMLGDCQVSPGFHPFLS